MGDRKKKNSALPDGDIESVKNKIGFSKNEWKVQEIFKIVLFLFLAAVLLGLFGGGLLGRKTITMDKMSIVFERFAREEAPAKLTVYLKNPGDTTSISFNSSYMKRMVLVQTIPAAINAKTSQGRISYLFNTGEKSLVIFYLIPQSAGSRDLILGVNNQTIHLNQLIYF